MVQIKVSVAFVLAAAAIAPVVAQPIREGREHGHVGHRRHHHHHHHKAIAEPPATEATPETPTAREFDDEFEVRSLLAGQNDNLNLLKSLESQEKTIERHNSELEHKHHTLESEDRRLEHQNRYLKHKERHLEHNDHRLERQERKLKHKQHSLTAQDKSLEDKRNSLERQNKALGKKDHKLALKGKGLELKNKVLEHEGHVLAHHDKALAQKGKALEHHNKVLEHKGEVLSKSGIIARDYAESEDMFERAFEDAESGSRSVPHIRRPIRGAFPPIHGRPFPIFGLPLHFGHGPAVLPHHRPGTPHRIHFGPGPVVLRHGPASPRAFTREFTESDDMFERDFEDAEFDARDFDDELYLD